MSRRGASSLLGMNLFSKRLNATGDDARTAKRIFSVTERVDVYLFANNNEELEELMVEFILAIRTLLGTDASASGGQWLIEENGKGGFSSRTPAIRIPIEFPWSLVDQPQQNVTPTGFNNGTKLNGELPD